MTPLLNYQAFKAFVETDGKGEIYKQIKKHCKESEEREKILTDIFKVLSDNAGLYKNVLGGQNGFTFLLKLPQHFQEEPSNEIISKIVRDVLTSGGFITKTEIKKLDLMIDIT